MAGASNIDLLTPRLMESGTAGNAGPCETTEQVAAWGATETPASSTVDPSLSDAGAHLPKSSSSAMPDPNATHVPRLKARVHERLRGCDLEGVALSALTFRPLHVDDFNEMVALHTEWFPVSYDEGFYAKSVRGELFTLVATYVTGPGHRNGPGTGSAVYGVNHSAVDQAGAAAGDGEFTENLLGMITMSTCCEHHADDISSILGGDCASLCDNSQTSRAWTPAAPSDVQEGAIDEPAPKTGCLAYILTLGVVDEFRRRGLARELLRRLVMHVDDHMSHIQAVYLHVVTYNDAAIRLYESMHFHRIAQFNSFYFLHGKYYDSFLYSSYRHGGRPPWAWRLRQLFGIGGNSTWKEWVFSAWSSLAFWRQ
eukprot:TRINITY_DN45518_c0_g1_i1.p1 TRINITY_DN45518_c0_g1~~TRINITY_DN45518_c0_g1_i1.p1  ORF type:complete len:368 (-),score=40.65 TRINITY_DN45518_c0_g1_i1:62-1165(-)